jgi:hypothetical protein
MQLSPIAKWLILGGVALIVLGVLWQFAARFLPFLGHLPGDIVIERENVHFYFPITTMILVSVVVSLLLSLILRLFGNK